MRHRLQVRFWGFSISADGIVAIGAALVVVLAVLAVYRF